MTQQGDFKDIKSGGSDGTRTRDLLRDRQAFEPNCTTPPFIIEWWAMTDSNRRPSRCKRDALPTELIALSNSKIRLWTLLVL